MTTPPVLALVGPTGSGKSAVALEFAAAVGAEIVAVDAFTVYRGMDIGTAKPTTEDRLRVPHHLIDVLDPAEPCSVEWFQRTARRAIDEVHGRGLMPLLVGGSGLYFRAVVDDFVFPPTDPTVRAQVMTDVSCDPQIAHTLLLQRDPQAANRIDAGNLRRTVRALEVIQLTGRPFSHWRVAWDDYRSRYAGLHAVGLDLPRTELTQRIVDRTNRMVGRGLLDEAARLMSQPMSTTARAAIGYAEAFTHVESAGDVDSLIDAIAVRTRQYAVRQQRWFRADPRIQWATPEDAVALLHTHGSG